MIAPGTLLPWQYRDDYTTEGFVTIIGNVDGEYIDGQAHCTYDVVCRCEDEYGERLPNVAANVRYLIHAANSFPKLLELLEKAAPFVGWASTRDQVVGGVHATELCDQIEAALAKAGAA